MVETLRQGPPRLECDRLACHETATVTLPPDDTLACATHALEWLRAHPERVR